MKGGWAASAAWITCRRKITQNIRQEIRGFIPGSPIRGEMPMCSAALPRSFAISKAFLTRHLTARRTEISTNQSGIGRARRGPLSIVDQKGRNRNIRSTPRRLSVRQKRRRGLIELIVKIESGKSNSFGADPFPISFPRSLQYPAQINRLIGSRPSTISQQFEQHPCCLSQSRSLTRWCVV